MSKSDCAKKSVFSRRGFLRSVAAGAALLPLQPRPFADAFASMSVAQMSEQDNHPNIVFILADDLGWHELGCYGNTYNETPNLDSLAANGIRFTDAYAAAPVCSPYRVSLMTGQYPARTGILDYLRPNTSQNMARQYVTIAESLKQAGYRTGMVGKWHLSGYTSAQAPEQIRPDDQGFDEVMITEEVGIGSGDYWHPYSCTDLSIPQVLPSPEYLVDRCNYEAVQFIERNHSGPFFLYLSHYAVHTTLSGKPDLVSHFESKPGSGTGAWASDKNPHLAAQLFSIDQGVGDIIAKLAEHNIRDNTIIVFMGDNGGESKVTTNGPLRAGKSCTYEGGIRVPLVFSWPSQINQGAVCSEPVVSCDFYRTFCEIANVSVPLNQTMDGVSLMPIISNPGAALSRSALYWHYPLASPHFLGGRSSGAIRKRDWKLIEFFDDNTVELYNLALDLSEQNNLSSQYPDKTAQLLTDLRNWRSGIPRLCDVNADSQVSINELAQIWAHWLD